MAIDNIFKKITAPFTELFFPGLCPHCQTEELRANDTLCSACAMAMEASGKHCFQSNDLHCSKCGFPIENGESTALWAKDALEQDELKLLRLNKGGGISEENSNRFECKQCFDRDIYYDRYRYIYRNNDHILHALKNFKFQEHCYLQNFLPDDLKTRFPEDLMQNIDFWSAVPGRLASEFPQGFSRKLFEPLIKNISYQDFFYHNNSSEVKKLSRKNRFFMVGEKYSIMQENINLAQNKSILLVDDFGTSGATLNFLAYLLKKSGAARAIALVFYHNG